MRNSPWNLESLCFRTNSRSRTAECLHDHRVLPNSQTSESAGKSVLCRKRRCQIGYWWRAYLARMHRVGAVAGPLDRFMTAALPLKIPPQGTPRGVYWAAQLSPLLLLYGGLQTWQHAQDDPRERLVNVSLNGRLKSRYPGGKVLGKGRTCRA